MKCYELSKLRVAASMFCNELRSREFSIPESVIKFVTVNCLGTSEGSHDLEMLVVAVLCLFARLAFGLDNGLGKVPQMGWNSWNHFGCDISDDIIRQTADAFGTYGLDKFGYRYVNIDDCWASSRNSNGNVQADPNTFPKGIADLASYVHSKGLLFGMYSDAGNKTCAGRPGSLGYETNDAQTYAGWGVDYLKYDNCNNDGIDPKVRYPVMRDALNKTGRPIFFSMCEWGVEFPATWAPLVGNSWRTTGDISDRWDSMITRADQNNLWAAYAGPGGWNDPDMLEVGNGGMTTTEYETHFSLWCLMKAPLLIGADVRNMSADTLRILTNVEVIAVNQDPRGAQGRKVNTTGDYEVWSAPLSDGAFAVILLNRGDTAVSMTAWWEDLPLDPNVTATVRDLWLHQDVGVVKGSVTAGVAGHGVVMYRITPVSL